MRSQFANKALREGNMNRHSSQPNRSKTQRQQSFRAANFAHHVSHVYIRSFLRIWPMLLVSYLVVLMLGTLLLSLELSLWSGATVDFPPSVGQQLAVVWTNPTIRSIVIASTLFFVALVVLWCRQWLRRYRWNAKLLQYIDTESANILTQTLANPGKDVAVRVHAAYALSEQTTPAIHALQHALADSEPAISKAAATALLIALRDYISAPSVLNSIPVSELAESLEAVLAAERALVALKRYYEAEEQRSAHETRMDSEADGVHIAEQAQAALEKIGIEAPYAQILTVEPNESPDLMYDLTH